MRQYLKQGIFAILATLLSVSPVMANNEQPDQVVKDMYVKIVDILKKDKDKLAADTDYLRATLDDVFFPIVNKPKMVALLLGRDNWKTTSKQQKKQFADKFFDFLVYKYGNNIALYDGQQLEFLPYKAGKNPKYAEVFAKITQSGSADPDSDLIRFSLMNSKKYGWRIFDIKYSSASIVKNFGYTYQGIIAKEGFDALLKKMDEDIALAKQPASWFVLQIKFKKGDS